MPNFVIARVIIQPGQKVQVPVDEVYEHGFVYVLNEGEGKKNIYVLVKTVFNSVML